MFPVWDLCGNSVSWQKTPTGLDFLVRAKFAMILRAHSRWTLPSSKAQSCANGKPDSRSPISRPPCLHQSAHALGPLGSEHPKSVDCKRLSEQLLALSLGWRVQSEQRKPGHQKAGVDITLHLAPKSWNFKNESQPELLLPPSCQFPRGGPC